MIGVSVRRLAFALLLILIASAPATRPTSRPASGRIVYVIDVGVSTQPQLERVKDEVYRGIANLSPDAQFNIVLASPVGTMSFTDDRSLVPAKRKSVDAAGDFLDKMLAFKFEEGRPHRPAAITDAVLLAMRSKAAAVWLVSDGRVLTTAIEKAVKTANPRKAVKVNTLVVGLYGAPADESQAAAARHMLSIASENGGKCIDVGGAVVTVESLKEGTQQEQAAQEKRETRPTGPSVLDD